MGILDGIGVSMRNLFLNVGNTDPLPDPKSTKPRVDKEPIGASGRAHMNGFIQWDETNPEWIGTQGLKLADRMWRTDADIKRDTLASWSPIVSASWDIVPYGGDEATDKDLYAADLCKYGLFEYMSPNLIGHLNEVGPVLLRSGFVDFEQIWRSTKYKSKSVVLPKKLDLRLPRTIWKWYQDDNGDLTGIVQFLPNAASVYIPATELLHYRLQAEGDNWVGTSMYRHAWKHFYYKEKLEALDAIGQERKAVGVPIVYPPTGATEQQKQDIETILANLHTNEVGFVVMPGPKARTGIEASVGWEIDIITFDSSSSSGIRESIDMQTLKVAGAFIADFLELGHHQVGARATADVQEDPFMTAVKALGDLIAQPANELCARIATLNVPGIEGCPKLKMSLHDEASLTELSTYALQLFQAGVLVGDGPLEDYFRARAGFPAADAETREQMEEARKAGVEQAAAGGGGAEGSLERTKPLNSNGEPSEPQDADRTNLPARGRKSDPEKVATGKPKPSRQLSLDAVADPPNYRPMENPRIHCGNCKMFNDGVCWGYGNTPVEDNHVCDSWKHGQEPKQLAAGEPTAAWYEELLSQGRLKEALDGARAAMEEATRGGAVKLAALMALRGRGGRRIAVASPPPELTDAFAGEMERLYEIGHQTVTDELRQQHDALGTQPVMLDTTTTDPAAVDALAKRRRRIKRRATIAAEHVTNEVAREVERAAVNENPEEPLAVQRKAELAALRAIHKEALLNAAPSINDGRREAAFTAAAALALRGEEAPEGDEGSPTGAGATIPGTELRGIYTSALDERSCSYCIVADDGVERLPEDPALTVPNPECSGGEFCRCTVVWTLVGAGEALEG